MGINALRVGDPVICICNCKKKRCPNGQVITGARSVFVNGRQATFNGGVCTNCCGSCCPCPNRILRGSSKVFIEGRQMARVGDPVRCGITRVGSKDTFIG